MSTYRKSDIPKRLQKYFVRAEIGLEPTPEAYVAKLVEVFREVRRVLKPDGTCWVNIGDTSVGGRSGGIGATSLRGSRRNMSASREVAVALGGKKHRSGNGVKKKDILGIPWMLAFALRADGWWLRMDVIWEKPAPVPESARDRPTRAHEYLFLLSKRARYFYDWRAIAEPCSEKTGSRGHGVNPKSKKGSRREGEKQNESFAAAVRHKVELRNRRSIWRIASKPHMDGEHTATFPEELPALCILASSRKGDLVLDPFAGECTTGIAAIRRDRHPILIELNPKSAAAGEGFMTRALEHQGRAGAEYFNGRPLQLGMFAGQTE